MKKSNFNELLFCSKGELSFIGITSLLFILSFSFLIIFKKVKQVKSNREKFKNHLCIKYLNSKTISYVKNISRLNIAIKAGFALSLIPASRVQGRTLVKTSQLAQNYIHFSFLKNLSLNSYCPLTYKIKYLKSLPYRTKKVSNKFIRKFDGTTRLRISKWKQFFILSKEIKNMEIVQISYYLRSTISTLESSIKHTQSQDFRLWKRPFGFY